ncbi:unnamed protein product [Rhizoctonia solani]|uniref:Uncharacterized protein n=1 Tax=Rhizoctonia solani TaxID=456999 RepID=A0A8H3D5B8_9AGAM|nr:unnamed protein product [Rhizoctonia solani]
MSANSPDHGNPGYEIGSDSDVGEDNPPVDPETDPNHNRHPYSAKRSNSTPLTQLQDHGAVNSNTDIGQFPVNLGGKQLETEGVKAFEDFDQRADEVDATLRLLGSSMQLFGSSVGVLHAIYQLRKSLLRLHFHFRENAAFLYGGSVKPNEKRYAYEVKPDMKVNGQINEPHALVQKERDIHSARARTSKTPNSSQSVETDTNTKSELRKLMAQKAYRTIGGNMKQVNEALEEFVERINEISGFHDELINRSFVSFAEELNYRAGAFERLKYQPNRAFKEHINKLAAVFSQHLKEIHEALKNFQRHSVPIIQLAQEHRRHGLQGLSAVATFFSGITASTIQYQLDDTSTPLQNAVNGLWIMSLACSIASAVSAQVAYFRHASRFSSPSKHIPKVIGRVLQYTPLAYLCCSVSTFMVGLSVFTFSSDQHIIISILIAAFTGIVTFELVVFGLWIILERIAYEWTRGRRWFLQIYSHIVLEMWTHMVDRVRKLVCSQSTALGTTNQDLGSDMEQGVQPGTQQPVGTESKPARSPSDRMKAVIRKIIQYQRDEKLKNFQSQYLSRRPSSVYATPANKQADTGHLELSVPFLQHNGLIKHLAFNPKNPLLLATCGWDGKAVISRIGHKMTREIVLNHNQDIEGQSSPQLQDGRQLFGRLLNDICVREVAWSLDGKKLATRTRKTVWIWDVGSTKDGAPWRTIQPPDDFPHTVEGIAWSSHVTRTPKGKNNETEEVRVPCILVMSYIPKEGQTAVESTALARYYLSTEGTDIEDGEWTHLEKRVLNTRVISIAVVDEFRLVAVGVDTEERPKVEVEKYLLLFNYITGETTRQALRYHSAKTYAAPLMGEVGSISVSTSQKHIANVLVTYKHRGAYPQLWRINLVPNPLLKNQSATQRDFSCIQSYFSKATSDFSGRGCFGGPDDTYVCCSTQEGEIFIWDRESGLLLYTIDPANDEHIKFFACNNQADPDFKCASGTVDGILSVWTITDHLKDTVHLPGRQSTLDAHGSAPRDSDYQPSPRVLSSEPTRLVGHGIEATIE